jgi:hypothetical protein
MRLRIMANNVAQSELFTDIRSSGKTLLFNRSIANLFLSRLGENFGPIELVLTVKAPVSNLEAFGFPEMATPIKPDKTMNFVPVYNWSNEQIEWRAKDEGPPLTETQIAKLTLDLLSEYG